MTDRIELDGFATHLMEPFQCATQLSIQYQTSSSSPGTNSKDISGTKTASDIRQKRTYQNKYQVMQIMKPKPNLYRKPNLIQAYTEPHATTHSCTRCNAGE